MFGLNEQEEDIVRKLYSSRSPLEFKSTYIFTFRENGICVKKTTISPEEMFKVEDYSYHCKKELKIKVSSLKDVFTSQSSNLKQDLSLSYRSNVIKSIRTFQEIFKLVKRLHENENKIGEEDVNLSPQVVFKEYPIDRKSKDKQTVLGKLVDDTIYINTATRPLHCIHVILHETGHFVNEQGYDSEKDKQLENYEFDEKTEFLADFFARSMLCHFNMFYKTINCSGFSFVELAKMFNLILEQCILRYLDITDIPSGVMLFDEDKIIEAVYTKGDYDPQEGINEIVAYGNKVIKDIYGSDMDLFEFQQGFFEELKEKHEDLPSLQKDYYFKAYKDEGPLGSPRYIVFFMEGSKDSMEHTSLLCCSQ